MFLVIVFVILMVVLSVIIITPPDPGPRVKGEKIRLDDIIHGKFKPNPFNATWHSGRIIPNKYVNFSFLSTIIR